GAVASLQNCVIAGSTARGGSGPGCNFPCGGPGNGRGAGIYNAGDMVIAACTIAANVAAITGDSFTGGGGIWNEGTVQITNSIVGENVSEGGGWPDAGGSFESHGFNLI